MFVGLLQPLNILRPHPKSPVRRGGFQPLRRQMMPPCFKTTIRLLATAAFVLALPACGNGPKKEASSLSAQALTTSCGLPNGYQDNSLQGHWLSSALPIKVSFHDASGWSSSELADMATAAETWNSFFTRSKGVPIFDYGTVTSPHSSSFAQSRPNCAQQISADGTVVYKRGTWSGGSSIIALTSYCTRTASDTGIRIMYNAIMEMNYQHFFVQNSGRYPDLLSITLHELGHLLGLGHSCGPLNDGRPNVDCANADTYQIRPTVMYPDWAFENGTGEQKRTLTENDQARANCLY